MKSIALYIHIPFCRSKCHYCAFYSSTSYSEQIEEKLISEIKAQIIYYKKLTGSETFRTVYIGGGTPSMLSHRGLTDLVSYISNLSVKKPEEFTIECNPEDISEDFLKFLNKSPIDRISLGVQSFNNEVLKKSGRISDEKIINKAITDIKRFWKGRFSIDIITGLPGQTNEGQLHDIQRAVDTGVDHISCYSLILEEGTPLFLHQEIIPDEEDEELMWTLSHNYLIEHNFNHYEVSNYGRKGHESLHNLQYWRMNDYIGCGPGAVSMIYDNGIKRITNPHDIAAYLEGEKVLWSAKEEPIEKLDFLFENYMMGLRTEEGINRKSFLKRFGFYPEELIKTTLKTVKDNSYILSEESFSLTEESRLFMNSLLLKIYDELNGLKRPFSINWP